MKFLVRATLDTKTGNALCTDKDMHKKMEQLMAEIRPESIYFGVENGNRTMFCICNIEGAHEIARIAEPFWLGLKATVDLTPVMSIEEFKKAGTYIETAAKKFNW